MLLTAVRARYEKLPLVGFLVGLLDSREPLDRRCASVDNLRSGEGFCALDQLRDRVTLLLDVCVAIVRLFHADDRRRRRLHA